MNRRYCLPTFAAPSRSATPMQESQAIRVRQIEANAVRATLLVSIDPDSAAAGPDVVYRGEVYGPLASDRTTLPARYRLPEFRPGEEARATVVDPCFWSPDSPLEYEILLEPVDADAPTLRRTIRLRPRSEMS